VISNTVPYGAVGSSHDSAALYLAHAQEQVRGHERWIIPRAGMVLGRELVAGDYQLQDPRMSRRHAAVEPAAGGGYQVRDLGSRNGTGVNGHRLAGAHRLVHGDVLRTGDTLAVFVAPAIAHASAGAALGLVGHSAAIAAVRHAVEQAARVHIHVLLTGESGVGKETVARALHALSPHGPFHAVMLSGSVDASLNLQLNAAWAAGATLFLDGVSEMPQTVQLAFARVLDDEAARAGGSPVRVIAATSRDLPGEVAAGRFRPELYARLAQHVIHVPPLRERREDIPLLVTEQLARLGASGRAVEADLAQAFLLSGWPLNLRGLANVVEAALHIAPAGQPLVLAAQLAHMFAVGDSLTATVAPTPPGETSLASGTRGRAATADELREALRKSEGNVAEAARQFGCSRQQIYRWMRAVGVDLNEFRRSTP